MKRVFFSDLQEGGSPEINRIFRSYYDLIFGPFQYSLVTLGFSNCIMSLFSKKKNLILGCDCQVNPELELSIQRSSCGL